MFDLCSSSFFFSRLGNNILLRSLFCKILSVLNTELHFPNVSHSPQAFDF